MRLKEFPSLVILSFLLLITHLVTAAGPVKLLLKSGEKSVEIQSPEIQQSNIINGISTYKIITFKEIPTSSKKEEMAAMGIRLYGYLPKMSFFARIPRNIDFFVLKNLNLHSVIDIDNSMKFHPNLNGEIPSWAVDGNDVNLIINYFDDQSNSSLSTDLSKIDGELLENNPYNGNAFIRIDASKMNELLTLDYIYFINVIDEPIYPENIGGRPQHRSNMLAQDFKNGLKYDGTGVNVGMQDDGIIGPHIDYEGRLPIQFPTSNSGAHGDHVAGTIMGAGNLDPDARGMAFGANLYVYSSNDNNYDNQVIHLNQYGVVIVSKSYSNGCNAGYTSLTKQLDKQIHENPTLIDIFSSGNNGTSDCGYGAGAGWGNVTGGHKIGKNVIATGNVTNTDALSGSSSRGPAQDGRIKPDICAKGTNVYSALDPNDYRTISGTSMACPGISGSFAQLYQAYKDMNGGQNPNSALIKAAVLNTGDDLGNPGPDFKYGWGRINAYRALKILQQNTYLSGQISATPNTHVINVPANTEQVRIMVYWHDYEANVSAARDLVNNLDMTVTDPNLNTFLPWVLNPAPNAATLNANAVRAIDSLNNMEQVTIDNPVQGAYSIDINPTLIPQGPVTYFVVYEFVTNEITLTYPNGGEGMVPFNTEAIRWDAFGTTGNFTLEYTINGGSTWNTIASSVSGSLRQYNWNMPNITTDQLKVRVSRGLISDESDENINVIRVPQNLQIDWICPDSVKLSWSSVTQAVSYRPYKLGLKYMDSVSTTSATSYVYHNIPLNEENWFSVSANPSANSTGKRAYAIRSSGESFNCQLQNDAAVSQVITPDAGTYFDCNPPEISAYVVNKGINVIQNVPVTCIIDGAGPVSGTSSGSINPGDSVLVQLAQPTKFSPGLHNIGCYVAYNGDPNKYNDSSQIHQFEFRNGSVVNAPWSEDFELMASCATNSNCGGTVCNLINGWVNDANYDIDDHDWRINFGDTPTNNSGPSSDHKPGTVSGKYVYTEASGTCSLRVAQMTSPCMNMKELVEPFFSYWYHMDGPDMGELHIDILNNGRWTYDVGKLFGSRGPVWRNEIYDLKSFIGDTINIRFRGITGNGPSSDLAIDDINLYDEHPAGIDKNDKANFRIVPNPANDEIVVQWNLNDDQITDIDVMEITGKKIQSISLTPASKGSEKIDISHLNAGVYFILIKGSQKVHSQRLIVL